MLRFYCLSGRNSQETLNLPLPGSNVEWARLILDYRTILRSRGGLE